MSNPVYFVEKDNAPHAIAAALKGLVATKKIAIHLLLSIILYLVPGIVLADDAKAPNAAVEYEADYSSAMKRLSQLSEIANETVAGISNLTSADAAKTQVDSLRERLASSIAELSDNSELANLGQKALEYDNLHLRIAKESTTFSEEERSNLVSQWNKRIEDTRKYTDTLERARSELVDYLREMQHKSQYPGELQALANSKRVNELLKGLADEIGSTTSQFQKAMTVISASPGV